MRSRLFWWHLLAWVGIPAISMLNAWGYYGQAFPFWQYLEKLGLYYLLIAIPFYLHYYLVVPKLQEGKKLIFGLLSLSTVTLAVLLLLGLAYFLNERYPNDGRPINYSLVSYYALNAVIFLSVATIVKYAEIGLKQFRREKDLENQQLRVELRLLMSQVSPHFLFNTLNSLYALARKKSDQTPESILQLSGIMRYLLGQSEQQLVSLDQEIRFMKDYLDLQKLRLEDDFMLKEAWPANISEDLKVPPFIFIPLLENVFKHADLSQKGFIAIKMEIGEGQITFETQNRRASNPVKDSGSGLDNLRQRLALLGYENALSIQAKSENFHAKITLAL